MPYSYRKDERVRKNKDFVSTMKGKRLSVDGLSLFYVPNDTGNFRIGISVGKKLANAIKRNRLKRQIRDCIQRVLRNHTLGYDLVFVARRDLAVLGYEQIYDAVETALRKTVLRKQTREGKQE